MSYSADISRSNPACFLFLIDQSGSMTEALSGQPGLRKMDQAADAMNRILDTLSQRCSQGLEIRDYFHVGVIAYNTDSRGNPSIKSALRGTMLDDPFLRISEVVDVAEVVERAIKEPDGAGGVVDVTRKVPVWFHPTAAYGTPMVGALSAAARVLQEWTAQYPESYPPIVINVTDGQATDGDPEPNAGEIRSRETNDGNALLFNVHLSSVPAMPIQYPDSESGLPDEYAEMLFRMSSAFPEPIRNLAAAMDLPVNEQSRGFVFNADMAALVQFLDIGTRGPSNLN